MSYEEERAFNLRNRMPSGKPFATGHENGIYEYSNGCSSDATIVVKKSDDRTNPPKNVIYKIEDSGQLVYPDGTIANIEDGWLPEFSSIQH